MATKLSFRLYTHWAEQTAEDEAVKCPSLAPIERLAFKLGVEKGFMAAIRTLQLHGKVPPFDYGGGP